jgi:hypothetical protein
MNIPNPDITYVVALEHNFWGVTTIFQYIGKYTIDYTDLQEPILSDSTNPLSQMQYTVDMIENHHGEQFSISLEAAIVQVADAISSVRP